MKRLFSLFMTASVWSRSLSLLANLAPQGRDHERSRTTAAKFRANCSPEPRESSSSPRSTRPKGRLGVVSFSAAFLRMSGIGRSLFMVRDSTHCRIVHIS